MNTPDWRGLNAYINSFDDCGGPVAAEMHHAKAERDALRALLRETRIPLAVEHMAMFDLVSWGARCKECRAKGTHSLAIEHANDCLAGQRGDLLARIDAALAEGAGDGE